MRSFIGRAARRLTWPVVLVMGMALLVAVAVVPTRTYLDKRQDVAAQEVRLQELTASNDAAQRHIDELGTDAAIEQLAREQYGMVKDGEEAYQVTPEAEVAVQIPDVWPFNRLRQDIG